MGLRPTNTNEGASGRCRGINNLDRAFNRAVLAVRVLAGLSQNEGVFLTQRASCLVATHFQS